MSLFHKTTTDILDRQLKSIMVMVKQEAQNFHMEFDSELQMM
jgi:hypothetical protein